jgi:hypothetical protein
MIGEWEEWTRRKKVGRQRSRSGYVPDGRGWVSVGEIMGRVCDFVGLDGLLAESPQKCKYRYSVLLSGQVRLACCFYP